jgi:SAM-dependent methyltransferase
MSSDLLREFYEKSSHRFWDPRIGMSGRDLVIYPLLNGLSGKLIEYGCGSGSLLLGLARENRFSECLGVDLSARALSAVQKAWEDLKCEHKGKLKLMTPHNDRLPGIADKSADIVVSVATIEHVLDPYVVLDELYRIATDKAVLICSVPNYAYLKHRIQLLFGVQPRTGTDDPVENWRTVGWDGMHLHTFTRSSFSILLNDCGWKPQKWTGWGRRLDRLGLGWLRKRYPGLLSGELITVCKKG